MAKGSTYSILVDVELQTQQIQQQLNKASKDSKINIDTKDAQKNVEDLTLTVDAAGRVFKTATQLLSSFVNEVTNLDSALVEFKKVSDLSGDSLDKYVNKLSKLGGSVARTGKPNRSEPVCRDGKAA